MNNKDIKQVNGNTWCLIGATNIPVYFLEEKKIIFFDSGYKDERTRPFLDSFIKGNNLEVRAVVGSHTHYDHVGNHVYLRETYGAEIIMPELEAALSYNYMMFAPAYGQYAKKELEEVFPEMIFTPDRIIKQGDESFDIDGVSFGAIDLKGHTPGQMGFITPDDVFYIADSLMGEDELEASKLPTTLDWEEDLKTKLNLLSEKHSKYILAHGGIYNDIDALININIADRKKRISKTKEFLKCRDIWSVEEIQRHLWREMNMKTKTPFNRKIFSRNVYYLVNYLVNAGFLESYPDDGIVYYKVNYKED